MNPLNTVPTHRHTHIDNALWLLATILFLAGDFLTTKHILLNGGIEANPIARHIMNTYGIDALLITKTIAFLGMIALWILAHHLVTLDEQTPLETRIENRLPHPLNTLYTKLPTEPTIPNNIYLKLIPTIPLTMGLYLTINNTLVIQGYRAIHTVILTLI